MELSTITYEAGERVARITLNRPERGNGITAAMPVEIAACVERANLDPGDPRHRPGRQRRRLLRRL